MADKPAEQAKRRVKNPETFRERALKAGEANDKPGKAARLRSVSGKVTTPVTGPVSRGWHKLFSVQPFKFIALIFHWIGLVFVPRYLRNSWKELRLVTWPSRRQSRQLTSAVLVFALVFGAAIAVVDYGLDKLFRNILLK